MGKVYNAINKLVCVIEENGAIVIEGNGCKTVLIPEKTVKYKIKTSRKNS